MSVSWKIFTFQASPEEINNAYRRMSRMFHPDKHAMNAKAQAQAQQQFTKIKKAHESISCRTIFASSV